MGDSLIILVVPVIILAAGKSERMGKQKLLLPLGQTTVLEQTVDTFLDSEVSEVVVVLGHHAEEIAKLLANRMVTIAVNSRYREGLSSSIIAGLELINDKAQGVMLALADQPFVDSQTINLLVEAFGRYQKGITIPVYQGRRGHPIIFATKYREELLRLKGDIGGREIIERHSDDIWEVAVSCKGICIDIDTEDIYNLCRNNPT